MNIEADTTRFTDFQVNEINRDGTVLHLHSIGLPGKPSEVRYWSKQISRDMRRLTKSGIGEDAGRSISNQQCWQEG